MNNNFYKNLKEKIKNCDYNFAQNILYHLIAPCVILLVGIILLCTVNFNLSYDFKESTVATVVIKDKDLDDSEIYSNVQKDIKEVCKQNGIDFVIYQKVETNYYGDAISVKFDRVSDEVKEKLEKDLLEKFYPSLTDEDEQSLFVKVDNVDKGLSNGATVSTLLAVLVTYVALFVYTSSRKGLCAGFVSLFANVLTGLSLLGLLLITRVKVDIATLSVFALVTILSQVCSHMYFTKLYSHQSKEIHSKTSKVELANLTTKDMLKPYLMITLSLLITALFMAVMPIQAVASFGYALFLGLISSMYYSIMLVPGLWVMFYIPKKKKKQKVEQKEVIVEEKLSEDDITTAPEVIVEQEAKEEN